MHTLNQGVIYLVIALVSLIAQLSHATSNWNQETRNYVVEIHNDRRRAEGGCQINKLVYDQELENQAKQWAERCVFKHELKEGRGENLAWNSMEIPEKELIKKAADSWFNEKFTYSYGQDSCGSSGSCHYTQMVWGSTQKIGCYTKRCGNLVGATQNAWYFVCFYTPKGNWIGEKPYEKSCPSPCLEGQTSDKGLCVGEGKGGKEKAAGDKGKCEDGFGSCAVWVKNGQCEANPSYMLENCKKSCKVCTSGAGDCKDSHTNCGQWAKSGQCEQNESYMKSNCAKSCNRC